MRLTMHDDKTLQFGSIGQTASQDLEPNVTTYAYRPVVAGQTTHFLSIFVPYLLGQSPPGPVTSVSEEGNGSATVGHTTVRINEEGTWSVTRKEP